MVNDSRVFSCSNMSAYSNIWHICIYDTYVYITYMYIWPVYMTHMYIWHVCIDDTYVYMTHMYIWHICIYGIYVYMTRMYIWHVTIHDTNVYMTYMSIWHDIYVIYLYMLILTSTNLWYNKQSVCYCAIFSSSKKPTCSWVISPSLCLTWDSRLSRRDVVLWFLILSYTVDPVIVELDNALSSSSSCWYNININNRQN